LLTIKLFAAPSSWVSTSKTKGYSHKAAIVHKQPSKCINSLYDLEREILKNNNSYLFTINTETPKLLYFNSIKIQGKKQNHSKISNQKTTTNRSAAPVVDFSFTNDGACSGETIAFTSDASGEGSLTYHWDFGDGTISNEPNPNHAYNVIGCGTANFEVVLTVTDVKNLSTSTEQTVAVLQKPDIEFFDVMTQFNNCGTSSGAQPLYEITVENGSNSISCIDSYTIDWGDGSISLSATFPATHTYSSLDVFDMAVTAQSDNGCENTAFYEVKNVTNPAGGFESPGNTSNLCVPSEELKFGITNWANNSSDTEYIVDFGDGTIEIYTQSDLKNSSSFNETNPENSTLFPTPHSYTRGSCLEPEGEFEAILTIQNACQSTQISISNIKILTPSVADFESVEFSCVNKNINFMNNSIIGDNESCNQIASFRWDFGDGTITNDYNISTNKNQSHSYSSPGTYTISLTVFSKCENNTFTREICIEPEIIPVFSVDNEEGCIPFEITTTDQANQADLCSPPAYEWEVDYDSSNCGNLPDWSFTNGTNKNVGNPQFIFNSPGDYTLTKKMTTSCGTTTSSKIITVKKPPITSIEPILDFCGTAKINPEGNFQNCTANASELSYNWSFSGGTPASSNSLNPGEIIYSNPGIYTITFETTNACGVSNTASETFEVFQKPTITNTNLTQELCSNQTSAAIIITSESSNTTYTWSASSNSGITGFITNGATNKIPAQTLTNTGSTPGTVKYRVTPSLNGCLGDIIEFTITVNPLPLITKQPIASDVCLNGATTSLEMTYKDGVGTASYQWFANTNNNNIDGTAIPGETKASYTPSSSSVGTTFYYVEISFSTGGCATIRSNATPVVVNPQATIDSKATLQKICIGGTANKMDVTFSGATGTPAYQWYSASSNANTNGVKISGETNPSYTPNTFSSVGTFYYYVEIILDGNGCSGVISEVYQVDVLNDPTIDSQPVFSQELCQGVTPTRLEITPANGTSSDYLFQWYTNTANNNTSGNLIPGATTYFYTPPTSTVGTTFYYVVVSQPESGCWVASDVSQLKVNQAPGITTQPIASDVCLNGATTSLEATYKNGAGTASYQWFANTNNNNIDGTAIPGETKASYTPPSSSVGTTFYYVEISFSMGGCATIRSNATPVVVNPQATISSEATLQKICIGGTANKMDVTFSGASGIPSYQWYSTSSNANTNGVKISGETNPSYTPNTFSSVGTFYYYVEIILDGNGCSGVISEVYQVDVLNDPTIDSQPVFSQELCQGVTPTRLEITPANGTSSDYLFQWYTNTANNNTSGNLIPGATTYFYTPPTSTVGTTFYYVVVSQPESGCWVASDVSQLKVSQAPSITTQPIASDVCLNGATTSLEATYKDGVGTASYQWFANTNNNNTDGTAIPGETKASYTPSSSSVGTTFYYVEISFSTGGCATIRSNATPVVVNPQATIDSKATLQKICIGGTANKMDVTFSGATGTPAYQWYSTSSNTNTNGVKISGETNPSYTPNAFSLVGTFYYYVEIIFEGNGCSGVISKAYQVNVLDDPTIDSQPVFSQELCQGVTPTRLEITPANGTSSDYLFQWYTNTANNTTSGNLIPGATTYFYTPPTSTVGTTFYYVVVSQPESGCWIASDVSKLKINQAPSITKQPIASDVCLNGATTSLEVTYKDGVGTASYQWFANTNNNNIDGTAIPGETKASYTPPSSSVSTTFYYVEISFSMGGCATIRSNATPVVVNQIPIIGSYKMTIYSDVTFHFDPSSIKENIVPIGTKYRWSAPSINPIGTITGSSEEKELKDEISQTLKHTGKTASIATYTVTPLTSECIGDSFLLEVTVNPNIISNSVLTNNNCFNANDASIETNIAGGVPFKTGNPYLILWSGPNGFSSNLSSIYNLKIGLYTLRIEDENGNISAENFNIVEPAPLNINTNIQKNVSCFDANDGRIEVSVAGGTAPYVYYWTTTDGSGMIQNTNRQNELTAGAYALEVTDKNNCTSTTSFIITQPDSLKINTAATENILCFGEATGRIAINVSGGTLVEVSQDTFDYIYSWTGPNGFTSKFQDINNLIGGTYTLKVMDNLGCITSASFKLNEPTQLDIKVTKTVISCYGETGSIDLEISGGLAPYKIAWSNLANGVSLKNLSSGTYTAKVTDGNNCVKEISIEIEDPFFFIDPVLIPISCNGENNGSINLNLTGGVSPIKVTWDDDASAGVQRNNLAKGTYRVFIEDSNSIQCPIEQTFTITNPPMLGVASTVNDAIDCGRINSGLIDLEVTGGTTPYSYAWSNGETTEDIVDIVAGDYYVEITDANGCLQIREFTIFRQKALQIEFIESNITDCKLKTVLQKMEAKVTGGFFPYTYNWSAGTVTGDNSVMIASQNGSYTLTITDAQGCTEKKSFLVSLPFIGDPFFEHTAFALDTYNLLSIEDPIEFTNLSTGSFSTVKWDFGDGSPINNDQNPVHTYNTVGKFKVVLTVEYNAGCVDIFERTVNISKGYSLVIPTAFTPNGDSYNDIIRPSFRGFIKLEMTIYNTWGTLVYFEKGTSLKGWDGLIKGKPSLNGNYVMVIKGLTFYKKEILKNSPVTLLR